LDTRLSPIKSHYLWAAVVLLTSQSSLSAQQATPESGARRTVVAERLTDGEAIALDGRLDEAVWARAVPAADFVQIDPTNGGQPSERTEVRIAFDNDAFYMGVTNYDSDPDGWLGFQRRRDEFLGADDRFMWTIDTFLDARSGYFFETNPSGLIADSIFGINGNNRQWDGIWDLRVHRSEIGWTIEVEIPFRTLNFNPESDTWGINFQRTVRRKNEEMIWTGWARNQGLRRMATSGLVTGIRDVGQGHGLDIKPYGLFTSDASPGEGRPSMDADGSTGVDIFYNPTPLLRANLTVNTDFAQTEVDRRQVNLTRYSLFFPEQRDFFLDGTTFFDFGSPTDADLRVNPFFSRRIGLSESGAPQKIDFGTKITGQIGAQDVGLLHVRTGADTGLIGEDFTVARVKRRVLRQSYFGALYTRRDPRVPGGETRHAGGLDATFATSNFLGSQNLETGGWWLRTSQPGGVDGGSAFGGRIGFPNDPWSASLDVSEVQENFVPAIGFVTRQNYRRYGNNVEFAPRPNGHPYIRQLTFAAGSDVQTNLRNELLTRSFDVTLVRVDLHTQDNVSFIMSRKNERLDAPFNVSRTIALPIGASYDFSRYRVSGSTASRRILSFNGRYEVGDFYSGTRSERVANLTVRPRPGLIVYLTGEWNRVDLPEGQFTTRLYRVVADTQFSPYVALVNDIQYDTQSAVLGWQSRFRWILTPGSDLYLVYTHNWLEQPLLNRFETLSRRFASKVLYTYRF
jgi:hypothetical protein